MQCTQCKQGQLIPSFLDDLFRAHTCNHCGGNWIMIEDFVSWKERNQAYEFELVSDVSEDTSDTKKALLCPVTGGIMRKFKIAASTDHRVDYSAQVGGIWLDKGEWELLKAEGVAGALNNVVTQQWQKKIREENTASHFAEIYAAKFGETTYKEVKALREWLNAQPNKADLRAYLLAEDPYSTER